LFDSGLACRTINSHRSAISAYHELVEGKPVGQHPRVCGLITGVFNQRPPQPRYTFVWDVECVINFIESSMANNDNLSNIDLSCKLTTLLALTSAMRAGSIQHLSIKYMSIKAESCTFYFHKLHKSWKRGKSPPAVTYQAFPLNPSLCVIKTIHSYLSRTESWRQGGHDQLLLSTVAPHQPVVSSTISGWLKRTLYSAGINTDLFKGHSTRSASTSKAAISGAPITEILKTGN